MRRGEWVRLGWSERQRFHQIVGFERHARSTFDVFGDSMKHVIPLLACGKRVASVRDAVPWEQFAGQGYSGGFEEPWYHAPPSGPPESRLCRRCTTAGMTSGGTYATDRDAVAAGSSFAGSVMGIVAVVVALAVVAWLWYGVTLLLGWLSGATGM